ncbi:MAG: DNA-binding protein [Candidatus Acididesulfobacter guangdongensis]|uniref:DNA-binding protein n=1 Tax=Acididesulfobacter guangdongensis TaxID=2597225 RepID=A0A519BH61_ACIG2|nr:MAG: DNA-binding protein [Candidatus Acididesulfobacter guangdongensis]
METQLKDLIQNKPSQDEPLRAVLISQIDLETVLETVLSKISANINKKWLTLNEAAEYLRISDRNLRKLAKNSKLPFYKLEGKILFKVSELDKYIEENKVKSLSELIQKAKNGGR